MVLFLVIVIVAILLGVVGAVVHGLIFLLVIGAVLLVADVVYIAVRSGHRRRSVR